MEKLLLVIKTNNFTENQWLDIQTLYSIVFTKFEFQRCTFLEFYCDNEFGYSFHGLYYLGDKLIGFCSLKPASFINVLGENIVGVACGSVMVSPCSRSNPWIFFDLYECLKVNCKKEKIDFSFGLPNFNALEYSLKVLNNKAMGKINFYLCVPILGELLSVLFDKPSSNLLLKKKIYNYKRNNIVKINTKEIITFAKMKKIHFFRVLFIFQSYSEEKNRSNGWNLIKLMWRYKTPFICFISSYKPFERYWLKLPLILSNRSDTVVVDDWGDVLKKQNISISSQIQLDLSVFDII